MTQPIPIIGAGLAGLTFARCLLHSGIRTTLYEKASTAPRHNYAITLHAYSYQPLLRYLGIDERVFQSTVAVDADVGGTVRINHVGGGDDKSFRTNRAKLEGWLKEGLDVRYSSALKDIETPTTTPTRGPKLHFTNGDTLTPDFIVAADGAHSIIRKSILPSTKIQVLPLVAINGKRRVDPQTYDSLFAPAMKNINFLQTTHGTTVLNISLNERTPKHTSISWTFSRPPHSNNDALYRPDRSNADARDIPEAFFDEIAALKGLQQPFAEVFDAENMKQDRVLHWLMRKCLTPLSELQDLYGKQRVVLLGDAAHAQPIVGGNGANAAMLDGVEFAKVIAERGVGEIAMAYETRYSEWERADGECEVRIQEMHESGLRNAASL
ncbi:FAD/NAD(P)-binding domain-containing protein [Plenodomus tracheiphilus IPT5]|uniref:FAD/NAD(P)-binding domain-containing protein n=1 Tax=Plenodomus tracheiphilus IPT5 TaxID=1408161 RepID=A0A6A7AUR6_9PLEO|nr:FAD/NAD(P)-binding domain-containing protein [Plenodomus tracheiphilus IPT5]